MGSLTIIQTIHKLLPMQIKEILLIKSPVFQFTRFGIAAAVGGILLLLGCGTQQSTLPQSVEPGEPRIVYLGWEEGETVNQLYQISPDGSGQKRVTDEELGVVDFAVAPDGTRIVYSAIQDDDSIDLWQIDAAGRGRKRLFDCNEAVCTNPEWAPDGRRLIYERRQSAVTGEMPSNPTLWWLDTQTDESIPLFEDEQQLGYGATISPNGRFLSYISPADQEIHVYNIETGERIVIPSQTGEPGVWSPDGETLLVSNIQFQGEQFSIHLFSTDLETAQLTNISGIDLETNDNVPAFSPDGDWIAFGRRKPRAPMGKQLWLMRPDGREAVGLTEDADFHYNNPAWSPDGTQIVTQMVQLAESEAAPELWVVDVETGEFEELVSPGIQPAWLP
jgi:Tol biopolymer transport system component